MNIGQLVSHPNYGFGTITAVFGEKQLGDGKNGWPQTFQSSITSQTNGWSRYEGSLNITVKFDNGGPQGWAYDSTNDIEELVSGE